MGGAMNVEHINGATSYEHGTSNEPGGQRARHLVCRRAMNMEQINGVTKPLVGSGGEACRGGANEYAP